jgi:hypothetical protein
MEGGNNRVDVQHLIGAVAERHGILLKPDDAAFALVTINELVLEQVMSDVLGEIRHAVDEFEQASVRIQTRSGNLLAAEVKEAAAAIRRELEKDIVAAGQRARELILEVHRLNSSSTRTKWVAVGITFALALFVGGILVGRMLP